ncbi:hypothetical protein FHL15_010121 [Xylaria flabelliformis]|uniref:F-box domain-containing protein n=1 Tax=Xylaria flabelliformis TaxID=2512241 RepID=A0A553HM14_9PEZI|nr:hypothetical protein FHL15_010121 [Xylaria flabelliformis]
MSQLQQKPEAAHPSHQRADSVRHGSSIERLPAELQLQVVENLPAGDLRSIFNLALTGPTFHQLIFKHEASLAENVVVSAVGEDLMRIAATVYELEELGGRLRRTTFSTNYLPDKKSWPLMEEIVDRHRGRDNRNWHTKSRITKFSVAASYLKLDVAVSYWAKKLAKRALKRAYTIVPRQRWRDDPESKPGPNPKPTATEMRRFRKALYFYQLLSTTLPFKMSIYSVNPIAKRYYESLCRYWIDVTPWEYEQVRQVEILLGCAMGSRRYMKTYQIDDISLHAGAIFEKYPEADDGPKFWWYYDLLMGFSSAQIENKYNLTSACRYCSLMLGYVFWDFERLRKMTREKCPSIDDLLKSSPGIVVTLDDYDLFIKDRLGLLPSSNLECDCMIGRITLRR